MKYDIIIVGAGPAGISTALHILNKSEDYKSKILVLEAGVHPRPKLCGGGVLKDAEYVLERLGLSLSEINRIRVKEVHFTYEGKGICMEYTPESFNIVKREEFDKWLVDTAKDRGIKVNEDVKVISVTNTYDEVKITTNKGDYFANVVVGADGTNSIVRKAISKGKKDKPAMALEVYVSGEKSPNYKPMKYDRAEFDFSEISNNLHGYTWDFPMVDSDPKARNRGIYCAKIIKGSTINANLKNILDRKFKSDNLDLDEQELQGFSIRSFNRKSKFSGDRILLVGDAAGVDPIYGEGISFALGYGEIAADEIDKAFKNRDYSFKNYKSNILKHPMGKCLKIRVIIAKMIYRLKAPWIQKIIWWKCGTILKWFIDKFVIDWAKDKE